MSCTRGILRFESNCYNTADERLLDNGGIVLKLLINKCQLHPIILLGMTLYMWILTHEL